ncbi:DUF935 domain-containing protein [Flexibacterium corallicola]|uniref:DUF935 domain-containing protein n=1 Tax=Flexibacterium corallicola TaxID=3037259 RepID=UPI00286F9C90|nr:DUF935 family protein [Pseudovibrio sp. M1P-2-3]
MANMPKQGGKLIATPKNDVTIPFYSDVLEPQDPTLKARAGGHGLKLYDEVKLDGRARTALEKRIKKATKRDWTVEPASEEAKDIEAADGIRAMLSQIPFDQICNNLLYAILKGYAVAEIVWHRNKDGLIAPKFIKDHDPARFRFDHEWKARLLTTSNFLTGEVLPERKFIVHRFGASGNNPYGLGLGAVLFWHILFKRDGAKFWMVHLEKFASPTPFGKVASGTSPEHKDEFLTLLRQLVQNGAIVGEIGDEVEFLEAKRSGDAGFEDWVRYWDEQTSEVVLGSTLSTGVKGQGSRAASQTHADETEDLVDDDCDQLSATLNETLIRWICEANWPEATPPGVWRSRPENEQEQEALKKQRHERQQSALKVLKEARLQGYEPKDTLAHLSDIMGVEMVAMKPEATLSQPASVAFTDADNATADLASQLEELAAPELEAWLAAIKSKLQSASSYQEASQGLLEAFAPMNIDPLGNLMGDAFALAELQGRSEVMEETGIKPEGSKKNT